MLKKLITLTLITAMLSPTAAFAVEPIAIAPPTTEPTVEPLVSTSPTPEASTETPTEALTEVPTEAPTETLTESPMTEGLAPVATVIPEATLQPTEVPPEPTPVPAPIPKIINIYYEGSPLYFIPQQLLIDETTMIPLEYMAASYGLKTYTELGRMCVVMGNEKAYFYVDDIYVAGFESAFNSACPTQYVGDTVYVSLRAFADAVGSTLEVTDNITSLDINMTTATLIEDYNRRMNVKVNQWGIASRTQYMVWVSLSEYKVRLYFGSQYNWELMHEAPCAIGAPGTPTVTGSFEYRYKDRWNYNGYYVGPCLVFYGGYALHSVLLNYDGTEYDGRTGVQISHGCVRMKKYDIDYIASMIPVGTRVYVTR